ncbi:MAG TPA: glycoside hydrolase family 2 TIM barrel-domain containing protein, partial [Solirubrobacteraceae bacterium]|nr:glycoside hydrolase family 2 TIM barrel-domain containing protein [Solirubrobacteraceae bacterium]
PAAVAVAFAGGGLSLGGDEPTPREQWGGHGGEPAVATGPPDRVALDGAWTVAADPRATGTGRGFQAGRFRGRQVELPYVPNARRITGARGERSHEGSVAWYRTTFRVPDDGRYALRFESVNHKASVWIDGRPAGEHVGTYLPFEIDAELEGDTDHTLVVRADWRGPDEMKAEGWHRTWFNFGGINREITIRPLPDADVVAPTVRTRLRGEEARVEVSAAVRNVAGTDEPLELHGTLRRGDNDPIELDFPEVRVPAGRSERVTTTVTVEDPDLWSPASPTLYDLELRATDAGAPGWRARVGLREISRQGPTLLLNGRPVKLHGASLHEDAWPRGDGLHPRDMDEIVEGLKSIGANATRAQHALNPALLERLDEEGILVWLGIGPVDAPGAWTSRGARLEAQARERVRDSVAQLQTHPSIFAWNLANEVHPTGHPAGQAEYIAAAAAELQRRDPSRLVALDVWGSHPPREDTPMYQDVDAIGWTNYIGWYHEPYATPEETEERIRTELAGLRAVFPDRVIVVTEFGAEGSPRNIDSDPGGLQFQADLLRTHIRTYASTPDLAGMLVWNLRDFAVAPSFNGGSITEVVDEISLVPGLNEKGLISYTGRPKPAAKAVREEFARLR